MKIGQLSALSGVPNATIRFYEQKGILPPSRRLASGYRDYNQDALKSLQIIKFAQGLGFSLDEIVWLQSSETKLDHHAALNALAKKSQDIDEMIVSLQEKKRSIELLTEQLEQRWSKGECLPDEELVKIVDSSKSAVAKIQ
ncbi:MerR family transcriptional regulator [Endozoicomonas sp. G2_1]|uniref:MerR family transcriptional regulator n=1 Tax=Endozoicomonas sp. G2_1 TaxID=2821091 RepID=UPI001ADB7433|nr:MerR family transcriptional regulator [Endozoicomonas sp. G2_1]MBO9489369.1 MerR family transcriptional regulator [Endozoicomonas sp. G2_1]